MSRIKEITATELSKLLNSDSRFEIIDIRTQAEIERGVIPEAKILPMARIPLKLNFFSMSDKQIVIYCRTGSRSAQVCRFLNKHGINNVINLRGGIVSWTTSGLPINMETAKTID